MNGWTAGLSGLLLLVTFGFDLITPQNLVLAILYNIPIALSTLALSRQLTLGVAAVALLANVTAGYVNAGHDHRFDGVALGNRVLAALSFFLVAILSLRAIQASAQANAAKARDEKANLERLLRRIVEELSGSLLPKELTERSCRLLQTVLEAKGVAIVETNPLPRLLFHSPAGWQVPLDDWQFSKDMDQTIIHELDRMTIALKPSLYLTVFEPQFPKARAVLLEILPTLQALLGKAELFERTQVQQVEITRRSGVIRDLVYAFSHDLRTPLMANALNMRLALEGAYGPMPEAYQQSLQHGLESNQELLEMAESLLLLARLESSEPDTAPTSLDLAKVIHEAIGRLQSLFAQKGVLLQYQGLSTLFLQGRELELRRLLQNLLDNALKFAPKDSMVWVLLSAKTDQAVLQVVDQGQGISKEGQAKLFVQFSGNREGGGGLGLYLCKQIVLAHRGQIVYRENPGGGSIFEVILPL